MTRHRGHRPLYEAISRSRAKSKRRGILERLRPREEKAAEVAAPPKPPVEPVKAATFKPLRPIERAESPPGPAQGWLRPKAVQLNAGRIEISTPYPMAIAVGLGIILAILIAFRLGQIDERARLSDRPQQEPGRNEQPARQATTNTATANPPLPATGAPRSDADGAGATANPTAEGDHVIVLAQYPKSDDLEPVREHFAGHGIETVIVSYERLREHFALYRLNANVLPEGDGYMLITLPYANPETPGTDGYAAKEKIKQVGALYRGKAPAGYESFAPNYFSDAYGMKIR